VNNKYPLKCRENIGQENCVAFCTHKLNKKHNLSWDEHTEVHSSFAALLPTVLSTGYKLVGRFFLIKDILSRV
jgi:hypothetical protein